MPRSLYGQYFSLSELVGHAYTRQRARAHTLEKFTISECSFFLWVSFWSVCVLCALWSVSVFLWLHVHSRDSRLTNAMKSRSWACLTTVTQKNSRPDRQQLPALFLTFTWLYVPADTPVCFLLALGRNFVRSHVFNCLLIPISSNASLGAFTYF